MSFFNAMNVAASGLTAQRVRMDIISENMANVETTKTENGKAYQRKIVLFQEKDNNTPFSSFFEDSLGRTSSPGGIRATKIVSDNRPGAKVYEPSHPDADSEGYLTKPNVNVVEEMVDMISSSRAYEAGVTSINITKSMITKTLEISR